MEMEKLLKEDLKKGMKLEQQHQELQEGHLLHWIHRTETTLHYSAS